MARTPKAKKLGRVQVSRVDGHYTLRIEDDAGKPTIFEADANEVLRLADTLDTLLADEEAEMARR